MAIYQPRNIQNIRHSNDGTVDNTITYMVDTDNSVVAYEFFVYNTDNTVFYDSGKQNLNPQLYKDEELLITIPANTLTNGKNYKYGVRLWQDFIDILISKGQIQAVTSQTQFTIIPNINIRIGMYVNVGTSENKLITDYNGDTGTVTIEEAFSTTVDGTTSYQILSSFIDETPLESMYVRNTPQILITNVKTLSTKSYNFIGQYIQQQNVPIVSYTFNIWQIAEPENILLMSYTNESAKVECFYDGFLNGQNYEIELNITNEFNVTVSTGAIPFTVTYDTPAYLEKPQIKYIADRNATEVQFQADNVVESSTQKLGATTGLILKILSNTVFIINQNLNIHPGDEIIIGHYNKATVLSYTMTSGELIVDGFKVLPTLREEFYINNALGSGGLNILIDTPYRRVNSAELNNSLVYDGKTVPQGIINDFPENWEFTAQLKFEENFLKAIHNNKYGYTHLIDINCDTYNCIGLHLGILNPNTLVVLIPNGTSYNLLSSGTQTAEYVHLTDPIDFSTQKFIVFRDYNNYVAEIVSYDTETKGTTFTKALPFTPITGDGVWAPNSLEATFGQAITDGFVLQDSPNKDNTIHTKWLDSGNVWDDSKYWNESGDFNQIVADKWWKIHATNTTLEVQEGGV